DNPLFSVYRNTYNTNTNRILGNTYFNASLTKDLSLNYKIGVDAYTNQNQQIYDLGSIGNDASDGTGQLNRTTTNYLQVYSDLILKYFKDFGKIDLNAFIGYNNWYNENRYNFLRGTDQTVPNLYNLGVYNNLYTSNVDAYNRSNAYFAEANLGYDNMIYLTLTGRSEYNTAFGKDSKRFFYPKADLSWIFSKVISQNDVLSFGKLRFAFSKAGVSPSLYSDRNYYLKPFLTDGFTNGNSFPYLNNQG